MALTSLTGGPGTSFRRRSHRQLTDKDIFAEVEKGDRVARGTSAEGFNKAYLTRIGREWLTEWKYKGFTEDQCRVMGFKITMWEWSNSPPSANVRMWPDRGKPPTIVSLDSPVLAPDRSPAVESEEVQKLRQDYRNAVRRFKQEKIEALHRFATKGSPEEEGLGLPFCEFDSRAPKQPMSTEDASLMAERDAVFDKVSGKGLREETQPSAPPGHKWVLQREKKKPRGRSFSKTWQPRWGRRGSE
jgi:hypothetical protein